MKTIIIYSSFLICLCSVNTLFASHIMGCDINYTNVGPDSFKVRLSIYRDCAGILPLTTEYVSVRSSSCSSSINLPVTLMAGYPVEVNQFCSSIVSNCSGGTYPGVQQYRYEGYVKLPSRCNDWVFSYSSCCRNAAITTINTPASAYLYIESKLDNITAPTNSSPVFTTLPVPIVCLNVPYVYNHGILEEDGDSTYYRLVPCNTTNSSAYVSFLPPRSALSPISTSSTFSLNNHTGDISFTPNAIQVGIFSVMVEEYRAGAIIGTTQRDIQVSVSSCNNAQPLLNPLSNLYGATYSPPNNLELCVGDSLFFNICGEDTSGIDTITMYSNFDTVSANAHFIAPTPSSSMICGTFSWATNTSDLGYHTFIVKVYDNNCPVRSSITHTYNIHVVDCGSVSIVGPDTATICELSTDSILLNASGSSSYYYWNVLSGDSSSLPCDTCNNFNVSPSYTTIYSVSGTSSGSSISDTIVIIVNPTDTTIQNISMMAGDTLYIDSLIITGAGTYYTILSNINGCDSILEYLVDEIVLRTSVTRSGDILTADQAGVNYQWIICGSPINRIAGAILQSYTVTTDADYAVILSIDSFYDTSDCIAMRFVGMNDLASLKNQIDVYPNPTSDLLHISFNDYYNYNLSDIIGHCLIKGENLKGLQAINLQNYATGIYLLKIKVKDQEVIYRINKNN